MSSNYCIECGVDMGPSNPRQLCCKSYCDNSFYYDDKSFCIDDKSISNDEKSICIDDKSISNDAKSICNDEKSFCIDVKSFCNDDKSFYEPDALAQDEPSSPFTEPEFEELEVIQKCKKYPNEHIHALSTLEAKVAHLEKQVNWLMKSSSSSSLYTFSP